MSRHNFKQCKQKQLVLAGNVAIRLNMIKPCKKNGEVYAYFDNGKGMIDYARVGELFLDNLGLKPFNL